MKLICHIRHAHTRYSLFAEIQYIRNQNGKIIRHFSKNSTQIIKKNKKKNKKKMSELIKTIKEKSWYSIEVAQRLRFHKTTTDYDQKYWNTRKWGNNWLWI